MACIRNHYVSKTAIHHTELKLLEHDNIYNNRPVVKFDENMEHLFHINVAMIVALLIVP